MRHADLLRSLPLLLIVLLLPGARASAQPRAAHWDDDSTRMTNSHLSLAIGVTSITAGAIATTNDSRLVLGLGVPLAALGVSDLILAVVERRSGSLGDHFDERLRAGRVGLMVSGAGLAGFGAYLGSDVSLGAGLALLGHSAFRLLMEALLPREARARPVELGFSLVPSEYGRVATATLGGRL